MPEEILDASVNVSTGHTPVLLDEPLANMDQEARHQCRLLIRQLQENGEIHFSKVAIKPGRPLTFGSIDNSRFSGLPGNSMAVMITFLHFVRRAIKRIQGDS